MSPRVMRLVEEVCESCQSTFLRPTGRRKGRCPACRLAHHREVTSQAVHKAGPVYEDTVRKQVRYWTGEAERLGVEV